MTNSLCFHVSIRALKAPFAPPHTPSLGLRNNQQVSHSPDMHWEPGCPGTRGNYRCGTLHISERPRVALRVQQVLKTMEKSVAEAERLTRSKQSQVQRRTCELSLSREVCSSLVKRRARA